MAKRALLVGCNYPGTKCELHGCANDVKRMRTTLVERFGFDESDILVMLDTDPSTPQPTGANIRSSLKKMINSVEPGDVLVFHYSGHGTQVPPESGAPGEADSEEAIVPTDMNLLTDDDVRELVNQIPAGVIFTFLSDSCHSGGMIDNEKEQIGGGSTTTTGGGGGGGGFSAALGGGGGDVGGGGGAGGVLMGLISHGLQAYAGGQSQTRDFHLPAGERIHEEEGASYGERGHRQPPRSYQQQEGYGEGYGEEGYEGEGRTRRQVNDEYEGEERGGYGDDEGYGGRRHQEQFHEGHRGRGGEEGYGGRRARRHQDDEEEYEGEGQSVYDGEREEGYGGRGRRGRGSQYYETEGGGRGYGAGEEGYYGGEEYQNANQLGRRNERSEEEGGYGGYQGTEPVSGYHHQSQQGGYRVVAQPPHQVSKNLPVDLLTQILSQRTGSDVQVGNIRTTLFDMFGDQASPSIKMFVNLALSQLQQQGGGQGGWLGTVSSLASQFLQTKLDNQSPEDASNYAAPAEQAGIPGGKTRVASDVSILISGCQANETSADANPSHSPANSYGAFSNAIQTVLSQNPSPMTNRDVVLAVRNVLAQQGFKQHPCLYCSDEKVAAPFICE